jgi:sugar transferase EpsL
MQQVLKRMIDIAVSISVLVLTAPVMALTALAIRVCLGSPILFRQTRPGTHGRPFTLVKFRTLREPTETEAAQLPSRTDTLSRLTRLGAILRRTSLDELPQLWNVLKGDMSLVGPRPLLTCYLALYSPEQMRRHNVKPGITGWAQVNGRTRLTWDEKFELDVWYVDNQSFLLDMKILLKTFQRLVHDTTAGTPVEERFMGSGIE